MATATQHTTEQQTTTNDRSAMRAFRRVWNNASPTVQARIREIVGPVVSTKHHMRVAWKAAPVEVRDEARRLVAGSLETVDDFNAVYAKLSTTLRKTHEQAVKTRGKKRKSDRKLSGFTAPRRLSPELCDFLGVERSTVLAGSEITHRISEYIKANGLNNGRNINADEKLRGLLGISETQPLSWFNLQTFLKVHSFRQPAVTQE